MASSSGLHSHPVIETHYAGEQPGEGLKQLIEPQPQQHKVIASSEGPSEIAPSVVRPEDTAPGHVAAPGASSGPGLEKGSVAAILGQSELQRASVVQVTPSHDASGLTKVSAPSDTAAQKKLRRNPISKAFNALMEVTPGTSQHKTAYGTRWSLGSYRLTSKKRYG